VSHYTPAAIKHAIKNTVSSATTKYGNGRSSKGGGGNFTSGGSSAGSKSYTTSQSRKGPNASSHVHALDDDAIELTRQNNQWKRLSGGTGGDPDLERGVGAGGAGMGAAGPKTPMSMRSGDTWLQDASPVTDVRSSQDLHRSGGRTPVDGAITVTTEVRLTRD
jgi:hypothetical protein